MTMKTPVHPGEILHLTRQLRHSVRALEPTTLTITMLLTP